MNLEIEAKIQAALPKLKQSTHILHMSCGADSLAAWLRMRAWGMDVTPVYMYYLEGLPLVEKYLEYLENYFDTRIYRLPHPFFWKDFQNGLFQSPGVGKKVFEYVDSLRWGRYDFVSYNQVLFDFYPDHYQANGMRVTDGINRANSIKKFGPVRDKTWLPIASMGFNDIRELLKKENLKLSPDYALFGMSFEMPLWWNAQILRDRCPITWGKILEKFPLAYLLIAQSELDGSNIPGGARKRITMYADHIIDWKDWKL